MTERITLDEPRWTGLREVTVMAWPIILGTLSHTIMGFCDAWMVSTLGTDEMAAIGSAGIWSYTFCTFIVGMVGCVSTFAAQSLGRGDKTGCGIYTWQGFYLSLSTILLSLILLPLAPFFFGLMKHPEHITQLEISYFHLRLIGYFPVAYITALASFFQAVNKPRIPMYASIVAVSMNLLLNYLLIFGHFGFPRMELAGAAIATVIAQFIQLGVLKYIFLRPALDREFHTRNTWRYHKDRCWELVRIGLPSGMNHFLDMLTWSVFIGFIIGRFGAVPLAANNIAISFMHLSFMPAIAINQAIAAIVGQWIGKKDIPRAKARTYTSLKITALYMACMGFFFFLFGDTMTAIFFSEDPEVIQLSHTLLMLAAFFQGFDAINIVCGGALRGAGDTRWLMWLMIFMSYCFFLPLALFFALYLNGGAIGAWVAATIFITLLSGLVLHRFHGEKWRKINIFSETGNATKTKQD